MVTGPQIAAHLVGDYLLQSHWMFTRKTKQSLACLVHVVAYVIPFLLFRPSLAALVFIVSTHFIVDRWHLARYVVFAKNFIAPRSAWPRWNDCRETGLHRDVPLWMSTWLLSIVENTMHILLNGLALKYLNWAIVSRGWFIKAVMIAIIIVAILFLLFGTDQYLDDQPLPMEEVKRESSGSVVRPLKRRGEREADRRRTPL